MKGYFSQKRGGFAISLEIMMSLIIVTAVCSLLVYYSEAYQNMRYFADVAANTCTLAARYGGNNSRAYEVQVGKGTIADNANKQIEYIAQHSNRVKFVGGSGGKYITVSDYPDANGDVKVTLSYKLADYGSQAWLKAINPGTISHTFVIPTIMQTGKLIR